jgi:hypothetical protein
MTSTRLRPRALENPRLYWALPVVAIALVAGAILLVRHLNEPDTLSEKVAGLILDATPHKSCLGGAASRTTVRASERPDLFPDLIPAARSAQVVACEHLGAVSVVLEFGSRGELERAFARSSSARSSGWCVVGAGAFSGRFLDRPADLARFCRELHGTVRPPAR